MRSRRGRQGEWSFDPVAYNPACLKSSRYAEAGVDIDAKAAALARAKDAIRSTFTPGVLGDVGGFGGLFLPDFSKYREPVLVGSTDGVGTKLKVAIDMGRHDTVGADLVNHCVNDILVQGAKPLFFLDYIATGKVEPGLIESVIAGVARACRENGTALLGGETAEMPGFYAAGDYDVAGTIVGVVDRAKIVDGTRIAAGDVALGLPSIGLQTNGYTLARRVFFETMGKKPQDTLDELGGRAIGDVLLDAHLSYGRAMAPLLEADLVHGMAHLTGGGFYDNIPRVLPEKLDVIRQVRRVARAARVRSDRARGRGFLRGNAPRLQHGDRHGRLRRRRRRGARRADLEGRGAALVCDRQREARQPPRRRRAAARVTTGGSAPKATAPKSRLAILLSGRGSNFEAIAAAVAAGAIPNAEIVAVLSDVPEAPGLARATQRGLPALAVDRKRYPDRRAHEAEMLRRLDLARPDLICLAGYMRLLSPGFVGRWRGRILNIHPALLPKFPGLDVQRRALEAGETESGCTVHFVDEGTDTGPIVLQRRVPILPGDTEESLSARILAEEHRAYPEAISRVLSTLPRP